MPRLNQVTPDQASGAVKDIYGNLTSQMGKVVNIFQGMGNSSAALKGYLSMSAALAEGELAPEDREVIYLAVSEENGCEYCVSAHTMVAKKIGLTNEETLAARRFFSEDKKRAALLEFVRRVIASKGFVSDDELNEVRPDIAPVKLPRRWGTSDWRPIQTCLTTSMTRHWTSQPLRNSRSVAPDMAQHFGFCSLFVRILARDRLIVSETKSHIQTI